MPSAKDRASSSELSAAPSDFEVVLPDEKPTKKDRKRKSAKLEEHESEQPVPKKRKQGKDKKDAADEDSKRDTPKRKRSRVKLQAEFVEEPQVTTPKPEKKSAKRKEKTEKAEIKVEAVEDIPAPPIAGDWKAVRDAKLQAKKEQAAKLRREAEAAAQAEGVDVKPKAKKSKSQPTAKAASDGSDVEAEGDITTTAAKPKRKRKTKEEKEAEAMPLVERTLGHALHIGAHVSAAGGVHQAIDNALHIGGNSFALFLKSQRKWANPPLKPEHSTLFHAACSTHNYSAASHVLPHGSYLVNLAHSDPARKTQAYDSFLDDLQRCESLGIRLYNFHPGNTAGGDRPTAIASLASHINAAHAATKDVTLLLETMAGSTSSNTLGGAGFADLRDTIALVTDKSRVGVCLDTCHVFAAGHDLRTPAAFEATMATFDEVVGAKYIKALHLNDSKAPLGSHRDLHANIGTGFLGLRAFHSIVNHAPFAGLPLVLETPCDVPDSDPEKAAKGQTKEDRGIWAREIKLLESLVGMDVESEEFVRMERELKDKGLESREKHFEQFERKKAVGEKKARKVEGGKKGRGRGEESEDGSDA